MTGHAPRASRHAGLRTLVLLLGAAIVLIDVVHWWRAARSHDFVGPGHVPLLVVGALLVVAGAVGRRFPDVYRGAATLLLNTLLACMLVELAAAAYLLAKGIDDSGARGAVYRTAPALAYYQQKPWGAEYWREFAEANPLYYAPYVVFRRVPFKGRYVNVGADRLRVTPGARCEPGALVVWMFGGSTMWGTGAPDSLTIPAFVQQGLAQRRPGPVCVVNFGESAYVSTQELVQLTLALQRGGRPNVVVFYDGVNDVYSAFQAGHAGAHQNEARIATRFRSHWLRQAVDSLATMAVLRTIVRPPAARRPAAPVLADSIIATYLGVVDVARALGRQYGFRTLFFWQPELSESHKPLTAREQRLDRQLGAPVKTLYREAYARVAAVAAKPGGDLFDISGALAADPREIFIDFAHIVPEGNARVADAMLRAWDAAPGQAVAAGRAGR
jgi:lysophospholipase L1-like esterase